MGSRDKRVDTYISKAAPFAQPILRHLRELVHAACPDVVETVKWSMPAFEYKGPFCHMAAFKQHAAFGFWKHALVVGDDGKAREAMGSFGSLKTLSDLPSKKVLVGYLRKAAKLNDEGIAVKRGKTLPKKALPMHPELKAAFAGNKKARACFDGFPPSCQREYLEWIAEARRDETRARRIAQAMEWMAAGKRRHWKHETC